MTTISSFGVGATAVSMAMLRALEDAREDRLFDDPLAAEFVHAAGMTMPPPWPYPDALLGEYFTIRTRFFDEVLRSATKDGCRQVVVLAAGLDSRFRRLEWPAGVRVFELDLPDVLSFKQGVLNEVPSRLDIPRVPVPTDLTGNWEADLLESGFDPDVATAWLAEGLFFYLSQDDVDRLCSRLQTLSTVGSVLTFDQMSQGLFEAPEYRHRIEQSADLGAAWQSGTDDPEAWLRERGWHPEVHNSVAIARSYDRVPPSVPPGPAGHPATMWLVHALLERTQR